MTLAGSEMLTITDIGSSEQQILKFILPKSLFLASTNVASMNWEAAISYLKGLAGVWRESRFEQQEVNTELDWREQPRSRVYTVEQSEEAVSRRWALAAYPRMDLRYSTSADTGQSLLPRPESVRDWFSRYTGLNRLDVPYTISEGIADLLDQPTAEAAALVVSILKDELESGLPVGRISVEKLVDYDAGQWAEVVFELRVSLETKEANEAWDRILERLAILQQGAKPAVAAALQDKIGLHLRWYP